MAGRERAPLTPGTRPGRRHGEGHNAGARREPPAGTRPADDVALLVARTRTLGADRVAQWDVP
ncbi:hypothetical protein ABZ766_36015, partial [Streptomyces sp. NPDC006670]|uniref:hypothetical protein n=1 Tax=Streptomyces sp. NPDC006670 TaxID=3154476 RepID=UPI00340B763B